MIKFNYLVIEPEDLGGTLPKPITAGWSGAIEDQAFWCGKPSRVVGFSQVPKPNVMSTSWRSLFSDPWGYLAVGLYVVTEDADGTWYTHWCSPVAKVSPL